MRLAGVLLSPGNEVGVKRVWVCGCCGPGRFTLAAAVWSWRARDNPPPRHEGCFKRTPGPSTKT